MQRSRMSPWPVTDRAGEPVDDRYTLDHEHPLSGLTDMRRARAHPRRRPESQSGCLEACGHHDSADHNMGQVIARRGVRLRLSGGYQPKERKRCGIFRQKAGEY